MTLRRFSLSALFLVGCVMCISAILGDEAPPKRDAADDVKLIQGTWVVVELQQANREATKEEQEFFKKGGYKITITGEKMIHSPDMSEVGTAKKPRVLELLEDGKVIAKAIYELKGDDLKICQGRKPMDGAEPEPPSSFNIKNVDATGLFPTLLILKRETGEAVK